MTLSKDEELFLSTISAEEFEKTFNDCRKSQKEGIGKAHP